MKTDDIAAGETPSTGVEGTIGTRRASLLLALAGFSLFSIGDSVTKSISGLWPGTAFAALRFFFGACLLAVLALAIEGRAAFAIPRPAIQLARAASISFSTACFFVGVQLMPLATATALGFMAPLFTAALSALFLKEHVSAKIWAVVGLAFIGVLVVLRPNVSALGPAALLPLGAAMGMALLMILNRISARYASPLASQMLVAALATPISAGIALAMHLSGLPTFDIGPLSWQVIGRAALLACIATTAHWLIYLATMASSAALIAPINYVQILFAVVIGWAMFGDIPDAGTVTGSAMIIIAGLWLFRTSGIRR